MADFNISGGGVVGNNPFSAPIYGFQRGIVLKNSDPANRGRVKVFLPTLARQLLTSNTGVSEQYKTYSLRFLGDNILSGDQLLSINAAEQFVRDAQDTQKIPDNKLHTIAGVLDWVDQASPLIGSGTIGLYNAKTSVATISDGPHSIANNQEGVPGRNQKQAADPLAPNVNQSSNRGTTGGTIDVDAYNRQPPSYINAAKGMFSVPRVGAHVWVFFEGGDITRPVYFAYSYSDAEWSSILLQNKQQPDIHNPGISMYESHTNGSDIYTGKTVFNSKGGVIEIIDTDGFESVRIADHTGSHISFDKLGISQSTAPGTNLKVEVNGDYFLDVKGDYIVRVKGEKQVIMNGFEHRVHGNLNDVALQKEWLQTASPALQNAARMQTPPNFKEKQQAIHQSAVKKSPNNKFCMPLSLKFKLPPGMSFSALVTTINATMKAVGDYLGIATLIIDTASEITSEVLSVLRNPLGFILSSLGDPIKLLGIKLCNKK